MARSRKIVLFVGAKKKGKSSRIKELIEYVNKKTGEPVIILDPNRQKSWFEYAAITIEKFKFLKKGIYRIVSSEFKEFFITAKKYFEGGTIVCEDASNFLTPQKDATLNPIMIGLRHQDVDLILVLHSIIDIPPYVYRQCNEIILLKTNDTWDKCKDKIPESLQDEFFEVFEFVNNSANPYEWKRIIIDQAGTL